MRFTFPFILAVSGLAATVQQTHNDFGQTGWNDSESALTPASIVNNKFGLQCRMPISGLLYAQPLFIPSKTVSGAPHDLLVVATNDNTFYAYDAANCALLWSNHVSTPRANDADVPVIFGGQGIGCFATPFIDTVNNWVFDVCEISSINFVVYKLNLLTGALIANTTLSGSVSGSGCGSSGGTLPFSAVHHVARPGLTAENGKVYVSVGGWDTTPWHGWVFRLDETSMSIDKVYATTPNSCGGSIWSSGAALSIDGNGKLYATTGNGSSCSGGTELSETMIILNSDLTIAGYFTPSNCPTLNTDDADVSASRTFLIPNTSPQLAVIAAKDYNVYLLDTSCLQATPGSGCVNQQFTTGSGPITSGTTGSFGGVFCANYMVLPTTAGESFGFSWNPATKLFNTTPIWHNATTYGFPGPAQLACSSNNGANPIVWMVSSDANSVVTAKPAVLRAVNPATGVDYWNSSQVGSDFLGLLSKYVAPTIANGRVYVGTQAGYIAVYGLFDCAACGQRGGVGGSVISGGNVTVN